MAAMEAADKHPAMEEKGLNQPVFHIKRARRAQHLMDEPAAEMGDLFNLRANGVFPRVTIIAKRVKGQAKRIWPRAVTISFSEDDYFVSPTAHMLKWTLRSKHMNHFPPVLSSMDWTPLHARL